MTTAKVRSVQDRLYLRARDKVGDFEFNDDVTQVFEDMVRRSVPGYDAVVEVIGVIASHIRREIGRPLRCFDLGCSRGAVSQSILTHLPDEPHQIDAVDSSSSMIAAAREGLNDPRVRFHTKDVRELMFEQADLVVMNLLMQFLPPEERLELLVRIRSGLGLDGALILTEKITVDQDFEAMHLEFKRSRGYSNLEIQQKRDALERVMKIDTIETHEARVREAGFTQVTVWFRLLNWVSFLARP